MTKKSHCKLKITKGKHICKFYNKRLISFLSKQFLQKIKDHNPVEKRARIWIYCLKKKELHVTSKHMICINIGSHSQMKRAKRDTIFHFSDWQRWKRSLIPSADKCVVKWELPVVLEAEETGTTASVKRVLTSTVKSSLLMLMIKAAT